MEGWRGMLNSEQVRGTPCDRPGTPERVGLGGGGASSEVVGILLPVSGPGDGGEVVEAVSAHRHESHPHGRRGGLAHTVVAGCHELEVT